MEFPEITLALFSLFNMLRLGSYLPQIIRVAKDTEGAKAISYWTWGMWIGANASTAGYAAVNIGDWFLFIVSALNTLGCTIVIALTMLKRKQFALAQSRSDHPPRAIRPRLDFRQGSALTDPCLGTSAKRRATANSPAE